MNAHLEVINFDAAALCQRVPMEDILLYSKCRDCRDEDILNMAKASLRELSGVIAPKAVYARVEADLRGDIVDLGFAEARSVSLKKFLGSSGKATVFAATLGLGADRLIARYSSIMPSRAVIADGAATAAIECLCDILCAEYFKVPKCERFSPGYGDLPLELQRDIITYLKAPLTLGLTLTDSLLLTPTKSVTAIVR